jgi:hypothetical protein
MAGIYEQLGDGNLIAQHFLKNSNHLTTKAALTPKMAAEIYSRRSVKENRGFCALGRRLICSYANSKWLVQGGCGPAASVPAARPGTILLCEAQSLDQVCERLALVEVNFQAGYQA